VGVERHFSRDREVLLLFKWLKAFSSLVVNEESRRSTIAELISERSSEISIESEESSEVDLLLSLSSLLRLLSLLYFSTRSSGFCFSSELLK